MPDRPAAVLRFEAIGTSWSITALTPLEHARAAILATVEDFDRTYSRFRPDSLIRQFSDQGGTVRFPRVRSRCSRSSTSSTTRPVARSIPRSPPRWNTSATTSTTR